VRPVFDDAGDLASVDVLSALCAVGRGGASGEVQFTGADGEFVRYGFDRGVLVDVETPPENSPAEVLIRAGKIQRITYEALTVGDVEDRFAVAVASGVISRREAGWGIKIAAIETLARVAASAEGSYTFAEGPPNPMQPSFRLPVDHWILELFLRSNDRSFVLRKIGATDIPVARVDGFAEGFAALGLTADADAVIEGIDGVRTIEKVVKRSRADEFATLKLLAALMTLGLIHPILEAPRPPAPPAGEPEPFTLEPAAPAEEEIRQELPLEPDEEEGATPGAGEESAVEAPEMDDPDGGNPTAAMSLGGDEDAGEPDEPELEAAPPSPYAESIEPDETAAMTHEPAFAPGPPAAPRDQPAAVNLPLFALTAPEEPATEPVIEREEEPAVVGRPPGGGARGWIIAAVAAAVLVAAVLLVRRPRTAAVVPVETPTSGNSGSAAVAPRETPPAMPAPKPKPPPAPPSEIVVSRAPAAPPSAAPKSAAPAKAGGEGKWASLAEAGRREFEHPGKHRYSIQLELACEDATLEKAFAADPGKGHLWISPYAFRGRRCYRVLWGRFADLGAARSARGSVPAVFSRDGNRPTVVALGGKTPGAGR
jgi:hypothetical protein